MAAIAAVPTDNDNDIDNTTATINTCYTAVFVFGECIVYTLEYIICRLPVPVIEDNDDTDDNDDEKEVEEMEEEL